MKLKAFILSLFVIFLTAACAPSSSTQTPNSQLSEFELDVISYFKDIALGIELSDASNVVRKWNTDIKVFVSGTPSSGLTSELNLIISELNVLTSNSLQIQTVATEEMSNFVVFFGDAKDYANQYPEVTSLVDANFGLFYVYWNGSQEIYEGHMYVDVSRTNLSEQKHLLREELTQSLGLMNDSFEYDDSIFQQDFTTVNQFSRIDKELIRLLYNPQITVGSTASRVQTVLTSILSSN